MSSFDEQPQPRPVGSPFERALIKEWQRTNTRLWWVAFAFGLWAILTVIAVAFWVAVGIYAAAKDGEIDSLLRSPVALTGGAASDRASSEWENCEIEPADGAGLYAIWVRNESCSDAADLVMGGTCHGCSDAGFDCSKVESGYESATWECVQQSSSSGFRYAVGA